jgi:hypothetical protein
MVKCGTKIQTLGANVASTSGTTVAPGNQVMGNWSASLDILDDDAWWWQLGIGSNDTSMTARTSWFDVGVNATNKILCLQGELYHVVGSAEQAGCGMFGFLPPYKEVPAGEDVYVRGASFGGAADSSMSAVVYALGG